MKAKWDAKKYCWLPALFLCIMGIGLCLNPKAYTKLYSGEYASAEYPFLQEGDYMLEITYAEAEPGCLIQVSSQALVDQWNQQGVVFASQELVEPEGTLIVDFHLDQPTESVVLTQNQRAENYIFRQLKLQSHGLIDRDNFFLGACLMLLGAVLFFFGRTLCGVKYRTQLILALIGFGASLPLFNDSLKMGHDLGFHLARLEGLYQGLRSGAFPVRINPVQLEGFGYLSSTMYPQLFLYPFAALRFLGVSTALCYKLLLIGISMGASFFTYYSVRGITKSEKTGMLAAILYTFAAYRLSGIYTGATLGETMAMTFLPLAAWGIYEVFWGDARKWYLLALGMTGVFQSHLLSTEMTLLFAALTGVIWLFQRKKEGWLRRVGYGTLAAVATLLWNMWTWLPILSYSREGLLVYFIQSDLSLSAVYPSQLFMFFAEPSGENLPSGYLRGEMPLSVGGILLVCSILLIIVLAAKRPESYSFLEKVGCFCLCMGGVALILTTDIFPWALLQKVAWLDRVVTPTQFIWRFLALASFFLAVAGAVGLVTFQERFHHTHWVIPASMVLLLGSTFFYFDRVSYTLEDLPEKMQIAGIDETDALYLYEGLGNEGFDRKSATIYCSNDSQVLYSDYRRKGCSLSVNVEPLQVEDGAKLVFPLYGYTGYQVLVNGDAVEWELSGNGRIVCDLPDQNALIQIRYRESALFLAGDMISLVSILGGFAFVVSRKRLFRPG